MSNFLKFTGCTRWLGSSVYLTQKMGQGACAGHKICMGWAGSTCAEEFDSGHPHPHPMTKASWCACPAERPTCTDLQLRLSVWNTFRHESKMGVRVAPLRALSHRGIALMPPGPRPRPPPGACCRPTCSAQVACSRCGPGTRRWTAPRATAAWHCGGPLTSGRTGSRRSWG